MTGKPSAVAVVEVGSLGAAYALVNGVDAHPGVSALEVIPLALGAVCLLDGPADTLKNLVREQRSADLVAVSVLPECPPSVLSSFYAVDGAPLRGALVVIEHDSMGKIFEIAAQSEKAGFALVEIKAPRAGQRRAALLLTLKTGASAITAEQDNWLRRTKSQTGCLLERIERVGPGLKNFFENIE